MHIKMSIKGNEEEEEEDNLHIFISNHSFLQYFLLFIVAKFIFILYIVIFYTLIVHNMTCQYMTDYSSKRIWKEGFK